MIQDVEELRLELHSGFLLDREVLLRRDVKIEEPRTIDAIAARIAQQIRAGKHGHEEHVESLTRSR